MRTSVVISRIPAVKEAAIHQARSSSVSLCIGSDPRSLRMSCAGNSASAQPQDSNSQQHPRLKVYHRIAAQLEVTEYVRP